MVGVVLMLYIVSIGINSLGTPPRLTFQLDCSTTKRAPMPKKVVFERSRLELSLDVSVGVHILLVVEQSSLESQSRGCAKTPILRGITNVFSPIYHFKSRSCQLGINCFIEDEWGPQWRAERAEIFVVRNILWPAERAEIF